jgi:hypothetical protein
MTHTVPLSAGTELHVLFQPKINPSYTGKIIRMGTSSPWWFIPLMTFAGVVFGAAASILSTWLTQRYALKTQLEVKRAESDAAVASALRAEKGKRYLAIVRNVESLYSKTSDPSRKAEFLTARARTLALW